jgi:hypothetical protein
VAGLLFLVIQVVHPPDTLASVVTSTWAIVHYASLVMVILFIVGIATIFASHSEKAGWLGLAGLVILTTGLILTAIGGAIEAIVLPVIASTSPGYVEGVLGIVGGHPTAADLGVFPTLWSVSGGTFLIGTLTFGVAMLRARVVPRAAAALFAFGLPVSAIVVALTGAYRLAAVPMGLGLAWMGYSVWSSRRTRSTESQPGRSPAQAGQTATA